MMFEKHLYAKDFFDFINEMVGTLDFLKKSKSKNNGGQDQVSLVEQRSGVVDEETQAHYWKILQILMEFGFNLVAKTKDHQVPNPTSIL